jgi:hypothetical protein
MLRLFDKVYLITVFFVMNVCVFLVIIPMDDTHFDHDPFELEKYENFTLDDAYLNNLWQRSLHNGKSDPEHGTEIKPCIIPDFTQMQSTLILPTQQDRTVERILVPIIPNYILFHNDEHNRLKQYVRIPPRITNYQWRKIFHLLPERRRRDANRVMLDKIRFKLAVGCAWEVFGNNYGKSWRDLFNFYHKELLPNELLDTIELSLINKGELAGNVTTSSVHVIPIEEPIKEDPWIPIKSEK